MQARVEQRYGSLVYALITKLCPRLEIGNGSGAVGKISEVGALAVPYSGGRPGCQSLLGTVISELWLLKC